MAKTLFARYETVEHARLAVQGLADMGLPASDVDLLHRTEAETNGSMMDQGLVRADKVAGHAPPTGTRFATGAGLGALLGGVGGLLIGIGTFYFRGDGSLVGTGRLMLPLLSAWMGIAMGGLLGGLMGMGVSAEPQTHPVGVRRIGTLVAVNTPEHRVDELTAFLRRHGMVDLEIEHQAAAWHATC